MRWFLTVMTVVLTTGIVAPATARQQGLLPPAVAEQRAARIGAAFTEWARTNAVEQGAVAVLFDGRPVGGIGFGGRGVGEPAPVASLSKAITALCASRLIDDGRLRYQDTVGHILSAHIARNGPPADLRLAGVTIDQLIRHRSGIPRVLSLAETRADWSPGMTSALEEQAHRIFQAPLRFEPGARYEYSNQAYVLLSFVIQTAAGEPYESYCRRTVLAPAGATGARLDPRFPDSARSGAGGWTISALGYARFADQLRLDAAFREPTRAWLADHRDDDPFYGLGYQRRPVAGGRWILHHNGLLDEPGLSVSAQYLVFPSGLTIALNVTPARPRALNDLVDTLGRIATGVAP